MRPAEAQWRQTHATITGYLHPAPAAFGRLSDGDYLMPILLAAVASFFMTNVIVIAVVGKFF